MRQGFQKVLINSLLEGLRAPLEAFVFAGVLLICLLPLFPSLEVL
jgi:hypothetical protein